MSRKKHLVCDRRQPRRGEIENGRVTSKDQVDRMVRTNEEMKNDHHIHSRSFLLLLDHVVKWRTVNIPSRPARALVVD